MKFRIGIFLGLFVFFSPVVAHTEIFTIDRMVNGNTILLTTGKKVRLIGLHVPDKRLNDQTRAESRMTGLSVEMVVERGETIAKWADDIFRGKNVFFQYDAQEEDPKTGEKLAYVFLTDEINLYEGDVYRVKLSDAELNWWRGPQKGKFIFMNATILKAGYADPDLTSPNRKYEELFISLYKEAKGHERGLWDKLWPEDFCIAEGKTIGICVGCWTECCKGLMPMYDLDSGNGQCDKEPSPMASGVCSPCGNDRCERNYQETPCSCPEDCQ